MKKGKTQKKTKVVAAKNANCGIGTRDQVKEKIKQKTGRTPQKLYKIKVQGKSGFCTSTRTIPA